jgi:hypothetical protein
LTSRAPDWSIELTKDVRRGTLLLDVMPNAVLTSANFMDAFKGALVGACNVRTAPTTCVCVVESSVFTTAGEASGAGSLKTEALVELEKVMPRKREQEAVTGPGLAPDCGCSPRFPGPLSLKMYCHAELCVLIVHEFGFATLPLIKKDSGGAAAADPDPDAAAGASCSGLARRSFDVATGAGPGLTP